MTRDDDPPGSTSSTPGEPAPPSSLEPASPPAVPGAAVPPARPGVTTFTIEGRAAPGLWFVGWLAILLGFGLTLIGLLGGGAVFFFLIGPFFLTIGLIAFGGSQAIERRSRGAAYAGPSPIVVFLAAIAATNALGFLLAVALGLIGEGRADPLAFRVLAIVVQGVVFVGLIRLMVVDAGALSWAEMGIRRFDRAALGQLLTGASFAVPVIAATAVLAVVLSQVVPVTPASPLPPTGTDLGLLVQLLGGAIVAPIVEEVLFRGFALTAWERTGGARGAIVRSSLLFAAAHVLAIEATGWEEALGLIVVGAGTRLPVALVLGWVFVRTRSIWAPIGLHVAFNGVLLVLAELSLRAQA